MGGYLSSFTRARAARRWRGPGRSARRAGCRSRARSRPGGDPLYELCRERTAHAVGYAGGMIEPPVHTPTLGELRAKRAEILSVAAAHRVTNVRVFGSV